jgi:transposase
VYTNQRFNLSTLWEGLRKICQGFKPDSGDLTVRDYRGASGNVRHGGNVNPLRNRKSGGGNPLTYSVARPISIPVARRNHSPVFKAKVALAAIKGDRTLAQLSEQFDVHANQITDWKDQLVEFAAEVFERGSSGKTSAPVVDIKTLHAKIGELTLENDFLEAALGKAGLPSAKR